MSPRFLFLSAYKSFVQRSISTTSRYDMCRSSVLKSYCLSSLSLSSFSSSSVITVPTFSKIAIRQFGSLNSESTNGEAKTTTNPADNQKGKNTSDACKLTHKVIESLRNIDVSHTSHKTPKTESSVETTLDNIRANAQSSNENGKIHLNNGSNQTITHVGAQRKQTHRKFNRQRIYKTVFLLGGSSALFGYSYYSDKSLSAIGKSCLESFESINETFSDTMQGLLDNYFPLSKLPLLPDVKDLTYPENLPTLVVDLDKVIVKMEHDRKYGWRVVKRPGADQFFKDLVYHYEIVVWSEDNFPVAQEVCAKWGLPVIGTLHRDQCKKRKGHYIKDIGRLGRNIERVVIVDHDPAAFSMHPENGILIKEFGGDPDDHELEHLTDFLRMVALSSESDVRQTLLNWGGGDINLIKRWAVHKSEQEKKSESRRSFGTRFFGSSQKKPLSPPGSSSGFNIAGNSFRLGHQ